MTWEELERSCLACRRCSLADHRKQVVFGVGNPEAEILLIGEGPGAEEDERGEPFVGRGGRLLDDMLASVGLDRTKLYIANIVKCRPPNNRDPLFEEQELCISWLRGQTSIMKPKIVVCLGRVAAKRIIKDDLKITQEHGIWFPKGGIHMMALYHPAYLLRDPHKKPETFADLKTLEAKILEICTRTTLF